jgi:hypothetical protein
MVSSYIPSGFLMFNLAQVRHLYILVVVVVFDVAVVVVVVVVVLVGGGCDVIGAGVGAVGRMS